MSESNRGSLGALGIPLAVGLIVSGWLVASSIRHFKDFERYVTVKGLAEREVAADLAIWPVVYSVAGNDLTELQQRIEQDAARIEAFLLREGFAREEISRSAPRVTDQAPTGSTPSGSVAKERYLVEATVTLRTPKVDAARAAIERSGELVREGVRLLRSWEYNTQYFFTALDTVKPEMIAEATRDARAAADKFAQDSGARLGGIRRAQQGYFSIEDRDAYSPEVKKIRVVTTVEYFLE
jgi:uncharacterized protein